MSKRETEKLVKEVWALRVQDPGERGSRRGKDNQSVAACSEAQGPLTDHAHLQRLYMYHENAKGSDYVWMQRNTIPATLLSLPPSPAAVRVGKAPELVEFLFTMFQKRMGIMTAVTEVSWRPGLAAQPPGPAGFQGAISSFLTLLGWND